MALSKLPKMKVSAQDLEKRVGLYQAAELRRTFDKEDISFFPTPKIEVPDPAAVFDFEKPVVYKEKFGPHNLTGTNKPVVATLKIEKQEGLCKCNAEFTYQDGTDIAKKNQAYMQNLMNQPRIWFNPVGLLTFALENSLEIELPNEEWLIYRVLSSDFTRAHDMKERLKAHESLDDLYLKVALPQIGSSWIKSMAARVRDFIETDESPPFPSGARLPNILRSFTGPEVRYGPLAPGLFPGSYGTGKR